MSRTCLDLFSGLGGFSAAFKDADKWDVVTVDLDPDDRFDPDIQSDVMDLRPSDLPDADVVLASPPCNWFTMMIMSKVWDNDESRHPRFLPRTEQAAHAVGIVYRTLWLIQSIDPDYWLLENPSTGMLRHFIGNPQATVHYCQYGRDYKKPTGLWGEHPPMEYRRCQDRRTCGHIHNTDAKYGGEGDFSVAGDDPAERAKVPYDLSLAIREAVEDAYANPPPEQSELPV